MTATAVLQAMSPNYALAQQVAAADPEIAAEYVTYPSPEGHGEVRGYLARPAETEGPFPAATRPDRFAKALESGADAVCVDLEDAVAADHKDDARVAAIAFLRDATPEAVRVIRINSPRTLDGLRDLLALSQRKPGPAVVAVPKIASPDEVAWLLDLLPDPDLRFIVQIETLRGVRNAVTITAASPRICAVMFGGLDLAAEIGVPPSWEALLQARSADAYASAEVGLPALDMPFANVSDPEGCLAEGRRSSSLGFTAKMAIHPAQIRPIHEAFTPDEAEVRDAERTLDAFRRAGGGVALLDGKMIERPVIRNAERLLARARRSSVASAEPGKVGVPQN